MAKLKLRRTTDDRRGTKKLSWFLTGVITCFFSFLILLSSSIIPHLSSLVYAAVPHLLNYQGRLANASGQPLEGAYNLTFRIYDAETAGNLLWEESQSVTIQKGIFSVLLGGVTDLNLTFDEPYFLEIKVGNEVMSPRQRITSSGYAIRSEVAEQAHNANTVNNIGASTTPAPNKLLPLDSNAKLPLTALKVYDSGWFAISPNTSYVKTHNLGTAKLLITMLVATDSSGSNVATPRYMESGGHWYGSHCYGLTTTQITWRAEYQTGDIGPSRLTATHARLIILALE